MKKRYLLTIALLMVTACKKETVKNGAIRPVFSTVVSTENSDRNRTFPAVVFSDSETKLSFRVGGIITMLKLKQGDKVKKGDLVATLDDSDYKLKLNQAVAALKGAEVSYQSAEASYKRVEQLYEKNSLSLADFEKAKAAFASAQAQLKSSSSQVNAARNQIKYAKIYAPMSGAVISVLAKENEMVGAGKPVIIIGSSESIVMESSLPASVIKYIKIGQEVSANVTDLPNVKLKGKVTEIGFGSGQSTSYPVVISIDNPQNIRPGMSGTITFNYKINNSEALIIPVDAVGKDNNETFVYVLKKLDDKYYIAHKQIVKVGELKNDGYEVLSGLTDGDRIATAGVNQLFEGRKVLLVK
jgi:RND family efflux transporter MFP subunit